MRPAEYSTFCRPAPSEMISNSIALPDIIPTSSLRWVLVSLQMMPFSVSPLTVISRTTAVRSSESSLS